MPRQHTFSFETPEKSPGFMLWRVTGVWQKGVSEVLEPLNLSHSEFVALASLGWLQTRTPEVTQIHIATHARMQPMLASKFLRELEQKGLVRRVQSVSDIRANAVSLTAKGDSMLQKAIVLVEAFDKQFFSTLRGDIGHFAKLLHKITSTSAS